MIKNAAYVVLALTFICRFAFAQQVPDGWAVFSTKAPEGAALQCANYSKRQWKVSLDAEKVVISSQPGGRGGVSRIDYGNGGLEGLNHGEWGGGLWWHEGASKTRILEENVQGLVRTGFGTLVFIGLDHLGLRSGKILVVEGGNLAPPTTTVLADLCEAPHAFTTAPDGSVLLVTSTKLHRIKPPGVVETLRNVKYSFLYPTSVAVTRPGVIYVGMRHFVTRLTPRGTSYEEDWLVPADCRTFAQRGFDCVCLAGQP